jgi:G protein beta subunit-like protein
MLYPAKKLNQLKTCRFLGAAGGHPAIRLYDINDTTNQNPVLTLDGHRAAVTSIGFQRDVRFLYSGSEDGTVKLWDLRSNTFSRSWDSKAAVNSVCLHPNQVQLISGDQDGSIKVWDIGSNRFINELVPEVSNSSYCQRASIQAVDLSEDGRTLIAATNHAEVFVWDPSNPVKYEPLAKFRAHAIGSYLLRARISPDCRSLVTTRYVERAEVL